MTIMLSLKTLLKGEAQPSGQAIYFAIVGGNFVAWLIVSLLLYMSLAPYSMLTNAISNLGNPTLNPRGWLFFSVAMVSTGVLAIPHVLWIDKTIGKLSRPHARVQATFMAIAAIGMVGVGLFNETILYPHYFFAALAFGGLGADMFLTTVTMAIQIVLKMQWPRLADYVVFMAILYSVGAWMIYKIATNHGGERGLDIVEWVLFLCLFGWLVGYIVVIAHSRSL
jgi:uncharacterized membrane protein YiaA